MEILDEDVPDWQHSKDAVRTPHQEPLATIDITIYGYGQYSFGFGDGNDQDEETQRAVRFALDNISRDFGEEGGGAEEET